MITWALAYRYKHLIADTGVALIVLACILLRREPKGMTIPEVLLIASLIGHHFLALLPKEL